MNRKNKKKPASKKPVAEPVATSAVEESSPAQPEHGPYWNLEGCKLFRRRKQELGMSFQQLADMVDGKRHALWKWWHGLARPTPRKRKIISSRMNIKHDAWLTAEERDSLRNLLAFLNKQKKMTKAMSARRRSTLEALGQC